MMQGSKLKAGLEADNPIGAGQFRAVRICARGRYYFFNKFHNVGIEGAAK